MVLLLYLSSTAWSPAPVPPAPDLSGYPYLYLRGDRPIEEDEAGVEMVLVGDVMLGRGVAESARSGPHPLSDAAGWLQTADLTIGNLEGVIVEPGEGDEAVSPDPVNGRPLSYTLLMPPGTGAGLAHAGFDLVCLANNHAYDAGAGGLAQTVARLEAAGVEPFGAGPGIQARARPVVRRVKGVDIAFLGFNLIPYAGRPDADRGDWMAAEWDAQLAQDLVRAARTQADVVVVFMHWGFEYQQRPDPAQRAAARLLVDAGADLVVGQHPHVVQPVVIAGPNSESAHDRLVAYSLGNFVFDQQEPETERGLALRVFVDRDGLRGVQALPVQAGPRPRLVPTGQAESLSARLADSTNRLVFECSRHDDPDTPLCGPVSASLPGGSGLFQSGQIDLTGDGRPEQVVRESGRVVVYSTAGATGMENDDCAELYEVWRSPAEWRVMDLALGDADNDGRYEMMLAFWRPDGEQGLGSHPFLVGYRGGIYRTLWGGSAVADPLRELELGDVDGDGVQELIVLEERPDGDAVSVWRWHGWGFAMDWRSSAGRYEDLVFSPAGEENAARISVRRR